MAIRGIQSRAARALLGWSQRELAEKACVGLRLLVEFEKEERLLTPAGMIALEKTLLDHGIELIDGPGRFGATIRSEAVPAPPGDQPRQTPANAV
jgi:transcriptional regulator with XRE-family HTH domain